MGANSDRRRLPRNHDDHDDHKHDDFDDDGGPLEFGPVFGPVPLDVVGLVEPVDVDHERVRRWHDKHDHKHDDHKHDHKHDDGRPVRASCYDDDDHDHKHDHDLGDVDNVDLNHDPGPVRLHVPGLLRDDERRLHRYVLRARDARPVVAVLHVDHDKHDDHDRLLRLCDDHDVDDLGRVRWALFVAGRPRRGGFGVAMGEGQRPVRRVVPVPDADDQPLLRDDDDRVRWHDHDNAGRPVVFWHVYVLVVAVGWFVLLVGEQLRQRCRLWLRATVGRWRPVRPGDRALFVAVDFNDDARVGTVLAMLHVDHDKHDHDKHDHDGLVRPFVRVAVDRVAMVSVGEPVPVNL